MRQFIVLFFEKSWEFFQIPWPGFQFSIGSVFLAVLLSTGALAMLTKMTGVSLLGGLKLSNLRGGNNRHIKVSKERKGDAK